MTTKINFPATIYKRRVVIIHIILTLMISFIVVGCSSSNKLLPYPTDTEKPISINTQTETVIVPSKTPVLSENFPTMTVIPDTPTPEKIICGSIEAESKLFLEGITEEIRMVPVLSEAVFEEVGFTDLDKQEILAEVVNRVGEIVQYEDSITKVVIPEYLDKEDVMDKVGEVFDENYSPEIISYESGMAVEKNESTILISVHANEGGKTVEEWKEPMVLGPLAGSFIVSGTIMKIKDYIKPDGSATTGLFAIPGQSLDSSRAVVIKDDGCDAMIVRINSNLDVTGILDDGVNFTEAGKEGLAWKTNPESPNVIDRWTISGGQLMERTQTGWKEIALPSGVEKVDYLEMHNGSLYAIGIINGVDEFATAKFNGKEWEKFDRPTGIAYGSEGLKGRMARRI